MTTCQNKNARFFCVCDVTEGRKEWRNDGQNSLVGTFWSWSHKTSILSLIYNKYSVVVVHLSDHNPVMVALVDYHIRAEQSINGKETTEYIHKVSMI